MNTALLENIIWILDKLDNTGELGIAYREGKLYISDCITKKRYLYDPENPEHAKFKKRIDRIRSYAKNKDEIAVYHIIVGSFNMMGDDVDMDNYLYLPLEYDFFKDAFTQDNVVLAYVDNLTWDIQENGSIGVQHSNKLLYRSA